MHCTQLLVPVPVPVPVLVLVPVPVLVLVLVLVPQNHFHRLHKPPKTAPRSKHTILLSKEVQIS